MKRREAIFRSAAAVSAAALGPRALAQAAVGQPEPVAPAPATPAEPRFRISLAQWSLHRALKSGKLDHLDFPRAARDDFGIDAVEYVSPFFKNAGEEHIAQLRKRCDDLGVRSVLIMCDAEGDLGAGDEAARIRTVENHHKWVVAAAALGCHSIRVNARSAGEPDEQARRAADGLRRLCEFADTHAINVIVENHGGLSSSGKWLAGVMKLVDHPRVGTLPDFGNFHISKDETYDRYLGVQELMPFARGVSAKSYDFNDAGDETTIDYGRMLKIVLVDAGYRGHIGIEYEGSRLSEPDGIKATNRLLQRLRDAAPDAR